MGVCGYTYDQVQQMPIDALHRAIAAKAKFERAPWNALFAAFGGEGEPQAAPVSVRPFSPELFDALFP